MTRDPIAELVHLYADAVVHRNAEQWGDTWAPDGCWELGPGRRVEGRDAVVAFWNQAMDSFAAVIQTVLNGTHVLDEMAGTGTGRWYVQEHVKATDGSQSLLLAHYDDHYIRIDDRWLFQSRELAVHYAGPADMSAGFLNAWG